MTARMKSFVDKCLLQMRILNGCRMSLRIMMKLRLRKVNEVRII